MKTVVVFDEKEYKDILEKLTSLAWFLYKKTELRLVLNFMNFKEETGREITSDAFELYSSIKELFERGSK